MRTKGILAFISLFSAFSCSHASQTLAQVATCQALTLYGNAARTGLCKNISTGKHWVCELALNPDIHLTFNAGTNLHITVRTAACEGLAWLVGAWPSNLALATGQPVTICSVNVQNYVQRLNAQLQNAQAPTCQNSFNDALSAQRINAATANFYIQHCNTPVPPCP